MFRRQCFVSIAVFLFFAIAAFGQSTKYTLHYYGVITNVNDQNMLNITQDLFAAQIRGIDYVDLQDKRSDSVKNSYSSIVSDKDGSAFFSLAETSTVQDGKNILFYTRIYRPQSDAQWECTFFAKNTETQAIASKTKNYDSYYKILSEAKALIQNVVAGVSGNNASVEEAAVQTATREKPVALNVDNIAGTWSGESNVSKIILMRSGRGFIVFSNGATMNITISLKAESGGQKLRIVQQDKFNASFYPDIERKMVLDYADSATPIEWNLSMTPKGTLEGTKKTLAAADGKVEVTSVDVVWTKK